MALPTPNAEPIDQTNSALILAIAVVGAIVTIGVYVLVG